METEESKPEEPIRELTEDEMKKQEAAKAKDRGNVHYKKREFDAALSEYGKARELDPDNMTYLTNEAGISIQIHAKR